MKAPAASRRPSTRRCSSPWLDASSARWVDARFGELGENTVQLIGSGVVWRRRLRAGWSNDAHSAEACRAEPSCAQSWRRKEATEVLPLVPVTATAISGWSAKEARRHQRKPAARIGVPYDRRLTDGSAPCCGMRIAAAPRAKASAM